MNGTVALMCDSSIFVYWQRLIITPFAKYFAIAKYSEKCYNIHRRRDIVVSSNLFSVRHRQVPFVPWFLELIP